MLYSPFFFCLVLASLSYCTLSSTLSPNETLTDNGETLLSTNQDYALGFFSPWNSTNRYIGIWFNKVPELTPIWVANRDNPLPDVSGILTITRSGNIALTKNGSNTMFWSSNSSLAYPVSNTVLQLMDNGNLVVTVNDSTNYLWQSFEHPCDTLIPDMKVGWNLETNQEWHLTSWRNLQDPSLGDYIYKMDPRGLPQTILYHGSQIEYRSGPWDGVRIPGREKLKENSLFKPIVVFNTTQAYYTFHNIDEQIFSRSVLMQNGLIKHFSWSQRRNEWVDIGTMQLDNCDRYGLCGPYGICNMNNHSICRCPSGFRPRLEQDWEGFDWEGGCIPKVAVNCSVLQEGFRKFKNLKLPDSLFLSVNKMVSNMAECKDMCSRNCSCMAYAKTEASGCLNWFGDLLDMKEYDDGGQDLYIRMDASQLGSGNNRRKKVIIVSVSIISGFLLGLIIWFICRRRHAERRTGVRSVNQTDDEEKIELLLFDIVSMADATNNFSNSNKIGEGGFGPVYKGILSSGVEVAVKRLSLTSSGQGVNEFKNEVTLIAKLQHRNLVRILGCCIEGDERMLVYEYMPNGSLDSFIFDSGRSNFLGWSKRYDIIIGIARGLLYLHRDSRLRIIHRDLKASNILLDSEMNPKISDFGIARAFGADQNLAKTKRVIGTYGYMSPEYAIDGIFSVKSDIFSLGVLVLEIVSGKRNRNFHHPDHGLTLLGHAWKLWTEEKAIELLDPLLADSFSFSEAVKCIQVGLLCVQHRPEDRPTTSSVVLFLDSVNAMLPQPSHPGFYIERTTDEDRKKNELDTRISMTNVLTDTLSKGR